MSKETRNQFDDKRQAASIHWCGLANPNGDTLYAVFYYAVAVTRFTQI